MASQPDAVIQVLGDSFAKRFMSFLNRPASNAQSSGLRYSYGVGYSGAKVHTIKTFIKSQRVVFSNADPLLLLLGTNDFLGQTPESVFKNELLSLLRLLRRTNPGIRLILVPLPNYPRARDSKSQERLNRVNLFFQTLQSTDLKVVKLTIEFSRLDFFHRKYQNSNRRDDIHFNDLAHRALVPLVNQAINSFS